MKVKILIPIYNDWQSLRQLILKIDQVSQNLNHELSIIIVNDASTEKKSIKLIKYQKH